MNSTLVVALVFLVLIPLVAIISLVCLILNLRKKKDLQRQISEFQQRFSGVLDVEAEIARVQQGLWSANGELTTLKSSYNEKRAIFDALSAQVAIFDEKLAFAEMGVYSPHFDFTDSETYKTSILDNREKQKRLIANKNAVICTTEWKVDGSAAKGLTMTNRNIRLTLRAFNNECDASIANVRWNNANAMEKRIQAAKEQIDKLNASNSIFVTNEFLKLKLNELYLTHEYREKLKEEREQRAEAARAAREEQKFLRDMERAEEEEDRYRRLLAKAKAEASNAVGEKLGLFNQKIEMLEKELSEAHAKVERAQAMAEKTRSGYVYVISNVGSFGEQVVKIGLTRRLDPSDRIRELGDASVPFLFDVHAIIYSDNAPSLERALHAEFDTVRINLQNYRKEFFRVSVDEVEQALARLAPGAPFFKDVEAQEYRETLARRNAALIAVDQNVEASFPAAI